MLPLAYAIFVHKKKRPEDKEEEEERGKRARLGSDAKEEDKDGDEEERAKRARENRSAALRNTAVTVYAAITTNALVSHPLMFWVVYSVCVRRGAWSSFNVSKASYAVMLEVCTIHMEGIWTKNQRMM